MVIKCKIKQSGVLEKGLLVGAITPGTNYSTVHWPGRTIYVIDVRITKKEKKKIGNKTSFKAASRPSAKD